MTIFTFNFDFEISCSKLTCTELCMCVSCGPNSAQLVMWGQRGDALRLLTAASEITWNNVHCISIVCNFCAQV
jgi:hypothetical protein